MHTKILWCMAKSDKKEILAVIMDISRDGQFGYNKYLTAGFIVFS